MLSRLKQCGKQPGKVHHALNHNILWLHLSTYGLCGPFQVLQFQLGSNISRTSGVKLYSTTSAIHNFPEYRRGGLVFFSNVLRKSFCNSNCFPHSFTVNVFSITYLQVLPNQIYLSLQHLC